MAVRNITGNYLICGNEVFVEGKSIGQFQSFESDETRENIVGTASIEMPFYTIAAKAAKEVGRGSTIAVQRVAKGPKVVSVSFNIQRREAQEVEDMSATTIRRRNARGGDPTPVYKLTRFLDELYENDEVFAIENTVLNDEIGIGWAFIKSYRFSPMQGDTFGSINLVLQEVNIADPLLYTNSANTQDSQSVPTTVK